MRSLKYTVQWLYINKQTNDVKIQNYNKQDCLLKNVSALSGSTGTQCLLHVFYTVNIIIVI